MGKILSSGSTVRTVCLSVVIVIVLLLLLFLFKL